MHRDMVEGKIWNSKKSASTRLLSMKALNPSENAPLGGFDPTIVDAFMRLVVNKFPHVCALPSKIADCLRQQKKINTLIPSTITSAHTLLLPFDHQQAHWSLLVFHVQRKQFEWLDSATTDGRVVDRDLHCTIRAVVQILDPNSMSRWTQAPPREFLPRLQHQRDCGLFVCSFASWIAFGLRDPWPSIHDTLAERIHVVSCLWHGFIP